MRQARALRILRKSWVLLSLLAVAPAHAETFFEPGVSLTDSAAVEPMTAEQWQRIFREARIETVEQALHWRSHLSTKFPNVAWDRLVLERFAKEVQSLSGASADEAESIAFWLREFRGPEALAMKRKLLNQTQVVSVRELAAEALAAEEVADAEEVYRAALRDRSVLVRKRALESLAKHPGPVASRLALSVPGTETEPRVLEGVLQVIRTNSSPEAYRYKMAHLSHPSPDARVFAVRGLEAHAGDPQVVAKIRDVAVDDRDPFVRNRAHAVLDAIREARWASSPCSTAFERVR